MSEPKVHASHITGPVGRGVLMEPAPVSRIWMPSCYADLSEERGGRTTQGPTRLPRRTGPATCDICRPRWFSATPMLPGWEDKGTKQTDALGGLRIPRAPGEGGPPLRWECSADKFKFKAPDDMYIGPSSPELDALTDSEQIGVARVRPLVQIYSVRTGEVAYIGHHVNLDPKVATRYDKIPPRPRELHILRIIRPTSAEWKIKSTRAPLVVNRERLISDFGRLTTSYSEHMGEKRPRFDNLDNYYKVVGGGDVVVGVNTHGPLDCEEAYAGREVSIAWLRNDGFPCDAHALRWVRTKIGEHGQ